MAILLRRTFSRYCLQCSRLKLFLAVVVFFGFCYILLLSNSIQQKGLGYATKVTIKEAITNVNTSNHGSQTTLTMHLLDIGVQAENETYEKTNITEDLPECAPLEKISDYNAKLSQATLLIEELEEFEVERNHPGILPGGIWKPSDCKARHKVAVVIPFRDRKSHLTRLLDFLIPIMQKQRLDFRFIVTEQYGDDLFNKGRIMNAAFQLAMKLNVDCVIFHDVDMFPQDDRTPYDCPDTPRHLGAFVSNLGYQLWYKEIVGGALAIRMDDYLAVNGYSNLYWAWGGEDDDMGKRILSLNYTIERPNQSYARFSMLKHVKRKRTAPKLIYKLLDSADTRWHTDGVNETQHWTIKSLIKRPLYYHLFVDHVMMMLVAVSNEPMQEPTNLLHFNEREFILFDFWKVGTAFGMFGSMMIVFLIAILHEAVIGTRVFVLRENIPLSTYSTEQLYENTINARSDESSRAGIPGFMRRLVHSFSWFRLGNSFLYGVQWTLMALLILFIATFNVWIIMAVLLGKVVGHFIFLGSARVSEQSLILEGGVMRDSPLPERRACS